MSYQAVFAIFAALWVGFGMFGAWLRSRPDLLQGLVDQINRLVPGLLGDDGVAELDKGIDKADSGDPLQRAVRRSNVKRGSRKA